MAEALLSDTTNTSANEAHWSANLSDDLKPWVSNMGLDKLAPDEALAKVLPMYRGAEQKLGVPADQVLRLPGKDAKDEDWRPIYSKLGLPEKPDGYAVADELKDDPLITKFRETAHQLGIPAKQFEGIVNWFMNESGQTKESIEAQNAARFDKELGELRDEWKGEDFDKNVALAKSVKKAMGLTDEEAMSVEQSLGPKRAAMVFAALGKGLGEARFVGGDSPQGSMSPAAAAEKIKALRGDKVWVDALLAGDAQKSAEWQKLHELAYGNEPVQSGIAVG